MIFGRCKQYTLTHFRDFSGIAKIIVRVDFRSLFSLLKRTALFLFCFFIFHLNGGWPWPEVNPSYLPDKLSVENIPEWMVRQVESSLDYYKKTGISRSKISEFYESWTDPWTVKYTIQDNQVLMEKKVDHNVRIDRYYEALSLLCKLVGLPNVTLLICLHDALNNDYEVPIFVMAKNKHFNSHILLPDFEALGACYQVLIRKDITRYAIPWERKNPMLIWRGNSTQGTDLITADNFHFLTRFILCELSMNHPNIIDAKFTIWGDGHLQRIPCLKRYEAKTPWPSYEEQLKYKYHIIIDGQTCAYTASGWKLFTNSLIFRPDSENTQWYYPELKPYVHYIPVKANLEDLLEKLHWAQENDIEAKTIADNARRFAKDHITIDCNLLYLYHLITRYRELLVD